MRNYSDLAKHLAKEKGIKVMYHYGNEYNDYSVFVPRVYHNDYRKAKVRVLREHDKVKNCLKITFNPDNWTKGQIEGLIMQYKEVIKRNLHGSCQNFLTIDNLTQVLVGIIGRNGLVTPQAKELLRELKTQD